MDFIGLHGDEIITTTIIILIAQYMPSKKIDWKASIFVVYDVSSASLAESKLSTLLCWSKLSFETCTFSFVNVVYDASVMYIEWMTVVYQKTVQWSGNGTPSGKSPCTTNSRRFAGEPWNSQAMNLVTGNSWPYAVQGGVMRSGKRWSQLLKMKKKKEKNNAVTREREREQSPTFIPYSSFVCHTCRREYHAISDF